jgi:hypothetical protein
MPTLKHHSFSLGREIGCPRLLSAAADGLEVGSALHDQFTQPPVGQSPPLRTLALVSTQHFRR